MCTAVRKQWATLIRANREKDNRLSVERTEMRQMFRLRFHADGHGDREVAAPSETITTRLKLQPSR
jgi:hypothetical protein